MQLVGQTTGRAWHCWAPIKFQLGRRVIKGEPKNPEQNVALDRMEKEVVALATQKQGAGQGA